MSTITTKFNSISENEFIDLLLSAARQGDANALENHLSSTTNSAIYINQIYDEAHTQKCTLLTIACLNGHIDVIRMLLSRFKPNLEVLNNVTFGDANPNQHIFSDVSVLWTAASTNNFEIVKLFVVHGAHVNHITKTNSTPLRGACYNGNLEMARYLIENGADISIAKENNDTNLMVSVCHKHFNMVTYLVDELKCDVNVCDNDGRSPLYDAVNCGSLELVEFLLKHGAQNFRAIKDQMSPLMWAAEKKRVDVLETISPCCSLLEQIEAEELIGSALICGSHGDRALDQAFDHFSRAFTLRLTHGLSKSVKAITNEIFANEQECQTVDELRKIQSNFNRMYVEALLVRERLLGSANAEYRYSLCYRGAILADSGQHHEAVIYWVYELSLCRKYSIPLDAKHLRRFASLFSSMFYKTKSIPMESVLKIISATTKELEHRKDNFNYNLYTLLFLITIISQYLATNVIPLTDGKSFYRHLHSINQRHYTTLGSGMSLLHLSLDNRTLVDDYHIRRVSKYSCLQTACLLLQYGAAVNALDTVRNTPLHILVSNKVVYDESILSLLCDASAHLDYANALGKTPLDLATTTNINQVMKNKMKMNLKCLCARLIRKKNVPFREEIAMSLVSFVEKH